MLFNLYFLIVVAGLLTGPLPSIAAPVLVLKDGLNMEYERDLDTNTAQSTSIALQKRGFVSNLTSKIPGINSSGAQRVVGKASEFVHSTAATPSVIMGHASKAGMAVKSHPVTSKAMEHASKAGAAVKQMPMYQAARKDAGNLASYVAKKGSSMVSRVGSRAKKM